MKIKHSLLIGICLSFVASVAIAVTYAPMRSAGGVQTIPSSSWGGPDGSSGIYERNDAGITYHKGNNTEVVLGGGSAIPNGEVAVGNSAGTGLTTVANFQYIAGDFAVQVPGLEGFAGNGLYIGGDPSDNAMLFLGDVTDEHAFLQVGGSLQHVWSKDGSYQLPSSSAAACAGCLRWNGTNTQYSDNGSTWTNVAAGGGSGTVTSVGMTVPSFLSVSGSPVTTAGTLAITLATEAANVVFAGPSSGSAAAPTWRALVAADLPASGVAAGSYGDATHVPNYTVNAEGQLTAAASTAIAGLAESAVTNLTSDLSARPTGSAASNQICRWSGTSTQTGSSNGTLDSLGNATFAASVATPLVETSTSTSTLTIKGGNNATSAIDFDSFGTSGTTFRFLRAGSLVGHLLLNTSGNYLAVVGDTGYGVTLDAATKVTLLGRNAASGSAVAMDFASNATYGAGDRLWRTVNNATEVLAAMYDGSLLPQSGTGVASTTATLGTSSLPWPAITATRRGGVEQVISAAPNITLNPALGERMTVLLGATSIANVAGVAGYGDEEITVTIKQDTTGGRSISGWATGTNGFAFASPYVPSPGGGVSGGDVDTITFKWDSASSLWREKSRIQQTPQITKFANSVYQGTSTDLPPVTWTAFTYQNSWGDLSVGLAPGGFFKDIVGQTHVRGWVSNGSSSSAVITTLPAGDRPAYRIYQPSVAVGGTMSWVVIDTDGTIKPAGATTEIYMPEITFMAEN